MEHTRIVQDGRMTELRQLPEKWVQAKAKYGWEGEKGAGKALKGEFSLLVISLSSFQNCDRWTEFAAVFE
jgi:hypothetical protein